MTKTGIFHQHASCRGTQFTIHWYRYSFRHAALYQRININEILLETVLNWIPSWHFLLLLLLVFIEKIVFLSFSFFFFFDEVLNFRNRNQSEIGIDDKKLSVELYVEPKVNRKLTWNRSNFYWRWDLSTVKMAFKAIHIHSKSFSTREKLQQIFFFSKSKCGACIWDTKSETDLIIGNTLFQ